MASWTDTNIPQFNPYVQQLPVEAMVQVGMQKQQQYDQGIEKIQTNIDNIAGLDVMRDIDKTYLQSKLNELGNNLKTVAAGDFSNFQLVNSVNGMTTQITKDKNVQTAVQSTAKARKELALMEEDRKAGKLTPDNEYYFNNKLNSWYSDSELGKSFNQDYIKNFDVIKFAKETFDAIKPDGYSFDEIYQKDANGNYIKDKRTGNLVLSEAMTTLKEEGYLPQKLEATINQIFSDPRVEQQLGISGEYHYRSASPETLITSVTSNVTKQRMELGDKLDELNIRLQADPNNAELRQAIKNTELALSSANDSLNETTDLIFSNPDAVKGMLYKNDTRQNYTNMFNFTKKSTEVKDNPRWKAQFDLQKEANAQSRWAQTESRQRREFDLTYSQKERHKILDQRTELEKAKIAAAAKLGKASEGMTENLPQDVESEKFNTIMYNQTEVENAATQKVGTQLDLVWSSVFGSNPKNQDLLRTEMTKKYNGQDITREQAIKNILTLTAKSKNKDYDDYVLSLTDGILTTYNTPKGQTKLKKENFALYEKLTAYQEAEQFYKIQNDIDKNVKKDASSSFNTNLQKVPFQEKIITFAGKKYTLTKQDAIDLAVIAKYEDKSWISKAYGTPEAEAYKTAAQAAKSRLEKAGKSTFITEVENVPESERELYSLYPSKIAPKEWGIQHVMEDVYNHYNKIDGDQFKDYIEKTSNAVRKYRTVVPNVAGGVTTGDDTSDKRILENLKSVANVYSRNENAVGVDAGDVVKGLSGIKNYQDLRILNVIKGVEKDASGVPTPYIGIGKAKLYLNKSEASAFNINPNTIYNDEVVLATEGLINSNGGTSSYGPINDIATYRQESAAMDTRNFPGLSGSKYTTKVNFLKSRDKYYPYIYINDGEREKIVPIPASDPNLGKLMREVLPSYITPPVLENLLNQK
jgi:hypothetical protein